MDKTEWPTPDKLKTLREKGITAYSPMLSRLSGTVLAVVVLYACVEGPLKLKEFLRELSSVAFGMNPPGIHVIFQPIEAFSFTTLQILLAPIVAYIVGAIACGLFQTRFLLMMRPKPVRYSGALFASLSFLLGLVAVVVFSALAFRFFTPETLRIAARDETALIQAPRQLFQAALPIIILVGGVGALLSWISSRTGFLRLHRMTKAEVIREMQSRE